MATITLNKEIEYPTSDGKPIAESDTHRIWLVTNIDRLQRHFSGQKVYVSGNLLVYYIKGDPHKRVAPDTFVVKNCEPGNRDNFLIWKERRKPDFVLENTSKKTRNEDRGTKKKQYAQIGVKEYFLYDPLAEWLDPQLQGFSLVHGAYERIAPGTDGSVPSKVLGIRFGLENGDLIMFDARTGERLLSAKERIFQIEERSRLAKKELRRLKQSTRKTNGRHRKNGD